MLFDNPAASEPVLISACLLGIPCRWHGRRAKRRDKLIQRLKRKYVLEIAEIVGAKRAYLKGGSPTCDRDGVTGETLRRSGIRVIRVG